MKNWHTGSGDAITYENMLIEIKEYLARGGKVFIGTDSQFKKTHCIFATAICLHGNEKKGGNYYFRKSKTSRKKHQVLQARIMQEVKHSIDTAMELLEVYPNADIEVHVDIGTTIRSATRTMADSVRGWLGGVGFTCKLKPESWASSSVADGHTK